MSNHLTEGFISTPEAKIFYRAAGDTLGFPIIFIHGLSVDSRMWQPQIDFFALHGYRAIAYDVRGFGQSAPASPHIAADDVIALMNHLHLAQAHIVGISMGGNIALSFAAAYPERTAKLVAVDADVYGFKDYTPEFSALFREVFDIGEREGALKAKLKWAKNPFLQPITQNEYTRQMEVMIREYSGIHLTNPRLLPGAAAPTATRLPHITASTLVVVGEQDIEDFQRMADFIVRHVPHARKEVILGAGHLPNIEQADAFNRVVLDFLG